MKAMMIGAMDAVLLPGVAFGHHLVPGLDGTWRPGEIGVENRA